MFPGTVSLSLIHKNSFLEKFEDKMPSVEFFHTSITLVMFIDITHSKFVLKRIGPRGIQPSWGVWFLFSEE